MCWPCGRIASNVKVCAPKGVALILEWSGFSSEIIHNIHYNMTSCLNREEPYCKPPPKKLKGPSERPGGLNRVNSPPTAYKSSSGCGATANGYKSHGGTGGGGGGGGGGGSPGNKRTERRSRGSPKSTDTEAQQQQQPQQQPQQPQQGE